MPVTHPFENLVGRPFGAFDVTRLVHDTGNGSRVWAVTCRVCGVADQQTENRLRRTAVRAAAQVRRPGCWYCRGKKPTAGAKAVRRPKPDSGKRGPRPLPFKNLVKKSFAGWKVTALANDTGNLSRTWEVECVGCGCRDERTEMRLRHQHKLTVAGVNPGLGCKSCSHRKPVKVGAWFNSWEVIEVFPPGVGNEQGLIVRVRCKCGTVATKSGKALNPSGSRRCMKCAYARRW